MSGQSCTAFNIVGIFGIFYLKLLIVEIKKNKKI